jgi:hypothetical protein
VATVVGAIAAASLLQPVFALRNLLNGKTN